MSSPASTSSLFNRLQLDDDLEDERNPFATTDTRDLFVTVDDPKKHVSTMETYITYRVSTKVRAPSPPVFPPRLRGGGSFKRCFPADDAD